VIDPAEAIINYLRQNSALTDLVNDRISTKWQAQWKVGQSALTVRLDGGPVDLYVPRYLVVLDLRCYAESQVKAMQIWRALLTLSQRTTRARVATQSGSALIYYLHPTASPSFLYDPTLVTDFVFCPFRADIAQESVT
jgi:hypothetical protein